MKIKIRIKVRIRIDGTFTRGSKNKKSVIEICAVVTNQIIWGLVTASWRMTMGEDPRKMLLPGLEENGRKD